jgi:predicted ATPase
VATEAPRRVFVHAGVVGWKGQAILVPGRSYSGKTTLIAALMKAGGNRNRTLIFERLVKSKNA